MKIREKWEKVDKGRVITFLLLTILSIVAVIIIGRDIVSNDSMVTSTKVIMSVLGISILGLMWLLYCVWNKRQWTIEKVYVVCGIVMGFCYLFLIPPYSVPDEEVHINTAYHVSNVICHTTVENEGDGVLAMRECDSNMRQDTYITGSSYLLWQNLFSFSKDTQIVTVPRNMTSTSLLYVIGGMGITVARILHLGSTGVLFFGRMFQMLFFVGAIYYAMRKMPFGKMLLFAVCMLPMTLQQTSSFSYDQIVLAATFVITALALRFAYSDLPVEKNEVVVYIVATILLVFAKSGAYTAVVFLPWILLIGKKRLKKKHIVYVGVFTIGVLLLLMRGYIASFFVQDIADTTVQTVEGLPQGAYVPWADSYAYSLSELLHHPRILVTILWTTIKVFWDYYIESMLGSYLGWLEITISRGLLIGFILVLCIAAMRERQESVSITVKDKLGIWLVGLLSIGASVMAMLLYWTPKEYPMVLGVQGRYFLPVLFALLLTLRNRYLTRKQEWNHGLIILMLCLQLGVLDTVIRYIS